MSSSIGELLYVLVVTFLAGMYTGWQLSSRTNPWCPSFRVNIFEMYTFYCTNNVYNYVEANA